MSAEIIILILGIILFLPLFFGLKNPKISISLGVAGILLIIYGGYFYGTVNTQQGQIEAVVVGNVLPVEGTVENVQVISPVNGDEVNCRIITMGVYPESHEKDLWVILKPSNDKYYPQSDHTNTSYKRNGEWQVITRFGGDKAEEYEIIVYETDAATSEFFSSVIQEWKNAKSYPGLSLDEIPDGATEVDRLKVSLQENCRGVF